MSKDRTKVIALFSILLLMIAPLAPFLPNVLASPPQGVPSPLEKMKLTVPKEGLGYKIEATGKDGLAFSSERALIPDTSYEITAEEIETAKRIGYPIFDLRKKTTTNTDGQIILEASYFIPYAALPKEMVDSLRGMQQKQQPTITPSSTGTTSPPTVSESQTQTSVDWQARSTIDTTTGDQATSGFLPTAIEYVNSLTEQSSEVSGVTAVLRDILSHPAFERLPGSLDEPPGATKMAVILDAIDYTLVVLQAAKASVDSTRQIGELKKLAEKARNCVQCPIIPYFSELDYQRAVNQISEDVTLGISAIVSKEFSVVAKDASTLAIPGARGLNVVINLALGLVSSPIDSLITSGHDAMLTQVRSNLQILAKACERPISKTAFAEAPTITYISSSSISNVVPTSQDHILGVQAPTNPPLPPGCTPPPGTTPPPPTDNMSPAPGTTTPPPPTDNMSPAPGTTTPPPPTDSTGSLLDTIRGDEHLPLQGTREEGLAPDQDRQGYCLADDTRCLISKFPYSSVTITGSSKEGTTEESTTISLKPVGSTTRTDNDFTAGIGQLLEGTATYAFKHTYSNDLGSCKYGVSGTVNIRGQANSFSDPHPESQGSIHFIIGQEGAEDLTDEFIYLMLQSKTGDIHCEDNGPYRTAVDPCEPEDALVPVSTGKWTQRVEDSNGEQKGTCEYILPPTADLGKTRAVVTKDPVPMPTGIGSTPPSPAPTGPSGVPTGPTANGAGGLPANGNGSNKTK